MMFGLRNRLTGLVLACTFAVFCPSPASAGCGDYLVGMNHHSTPLQESPAKPCNGPGCHRHQSLPMSVPPTVTPPTFSVFDAFLDSNPDDFAGSLVTMSAEADFIPTQVFIDGLLRPPRV
jgi:hypothetical protein